LSIAVFPLRAHAQDVLGRHPGGHTAFFVSTPFDEISSLEIDLRFLRVLAKSFE
jgi:hypothetical protein